MSGTEAIGILQQLLADSERAEFEHLSQVPVDDRDREALRLVLSEHEEMRRKLALVAEEVADDHGINFEGGGERRKEPFESE